MISSKIARAEVEGRLEEFQSRNRGSFDFKDGLTKMNDYYFPGFNLVIEVLLISSNNGHLEKWFLTSRFNLVIEVLLISRGRDLGGDVHDSCFNLVIEVLLISSEYVYF